MKWGYAQNLSKVNNIQHISWIKNKKVKKKKENCMNNWLV